MVRRCVTAFALLSLLIILLSYFLEVGTRTWEATVHIVKILVGQGRTDQSTPLMGILDTWYIRRVPSNGMPREASGGSAHQLRSAMSRPPRLGTALATGRSAVAEPPRRAMSRPDAGRAPAPSRRGGEVEPRRAASRPEEERLGELGPRRATSRPEEEARWRGGEASRWWRGEGLRPPSRLCCSRWSAAAATSSSHLEVGGARGVRACMRARVGALVCVHACMRACVHACMRACVHACVRVRAWRT